MIYYFLGESPGPSGGHQFLYQQVILLNELGYEAKVLHPRKGYVFHNWLGDPPPIAGPETRVGPGDLVVVPEILAEAGARFAGRSGAEFAVANVDAYLGVTPGALEAHRKAKFVLANGEDTLRILSSVFGLRKLYPVQPSIDWGWWLGPVEKEKRIVAIPRKRGFEWNFVRTFFDEPGWEIVELDNVPIGRVREEFHRAAIVVGLARFESVSLQYLEAAAARCQVVGFDGFGAREYWDPPIFKATKEGDPVALLRDLQKAARDWKGWTLEMEQQRLELAEIYSRENELEMLKRIPEWPGFARQ